MRLRSAGLNPAAACSGGLLHCCCWLQPKAAAGRPAEHGVEPVKGGE